MSGFRPLKETEKILLTKMLSLDFTGRDELRSQMDNLMAKAIDNVGSLQLKVSSGDRTPYDRDVAVEATYLDKNAFESSGSKGPTPRVNLLLHVVDGFMRELEVYKDDGSEILLLPQPDLLQLFSRFEKRVGGSRDG